MVVEKNNKVTVEYEGRLDNKDGDIFDTSEGKPALVFVAGVKMVVPGFDNAILGMEKGEEKEVVLKPEDAYGQYNDQLKQKIPRNVLPADKIPEAGMMLVMAAPEGQQIPAKITEVTDEEITIDINPPLAGKTLYFKLKVIDYEEINPEEFIKPHSYNCSCSEDDACKTGEEDCKCEPDKKESSIEDLAEGK